MLAAVLWDSSSDAEAVLGAHRLALDVQGRAFVDKPPGECSVLDCRLIGYGLVADWIAHCALSNRNLPVSLPLCFQRLFFAMLTNHSMCLSSFSLCPSLSSLPLSLSTVLLFVFDAAAQQRRDKAEEVPFA